MLDGYHWKGEPTNKPRGGTGTPPTILFVAVPLWSRSSSHGWILSQPQQPSSLSPRGEPIDCRPPKSIAGDIPELSFDSHRRTEMPLHKEEVLLRSLLDNAAEELAMEGNRSIARWAAFLPLVLQYNTKGKRVSEGRVRNEWNGYYCLSGFIYCYWVAGFSAFGLLLWWVGPLISLCLRCSICQGRFECVLGHTNLLIIWFKFNKHFNRLSSWFV